MAKKDKAIVLDGVDLLLVASIVGIAVVAMALAVPVLPSLGAGLWKACGHVLMFWRWPFWAWTILFTTSLTVSLWLRKQFGG